MLLFIYSAVYSQTPNKNLISSHLLIHAMLQYSLPFCVFHVHFSCYNSHGNSP